jgi:hypothetical protein
LFAPLLPPPSATPQITSLPGDEMTTELYGDLPVSERAARPGQERRWMVRHDETVAEERNAGPLFGHESALMVGTNGTAAFALLGACEQGTQAIKEYRAQLVRVEHAALVRGWKEQVRQLSTRKEAQRLLDTLVAQCKLDPPLRPLVRRHVSRRLTEKLRALPETGKPEGGGTCADRPTLRLLCAVFDATPVESQPNAYTAYALWTCNAAAANGRWKQTHLNVGARGGVPAAACNETHVAVVCPAGAGVRVSVHRVREYGAVDEQPERVVTFAFPDEFGDEGLMSAHMSADGALAVAFGSGVVLVPATPSVPLASVRVDGDNVVVTSVSLNGEMLALGTSSGVSFGVSTRTLEALWMDCVPAVEPVVGVSTSNGRVVMQTVTGVCGRMLPFVPGSGLTYLPMPRPLCAQVCGTLLFVLDKYGGIQLLSTVMRNVSFPFRAPERHVVVSDGQYHYAALHAAPARLTCLYPDGTLRILELAK